MDNRNMINRVLVKRYYIKLQSKIKVMLLMRHMIFIQGPKNINVIQKMKSLYNYLKKSYRNEYFYKTQCLINSF